LTIIPSNSTDINLPLFKKISLLSHHRLFVSSLNPSLFKKCLKRITNFSLDTFLDKEINPFIESIYSDQFLLHSSPYMREASSGIDIRYIFLLILYYPFVFTLKVYFMKKLIVTYHRYNFYSKLISFFLNAIFISFLCFHIILYSFISELLRTLIELIKNENYSNSFIQPLEVLLEDTWSSITEEDIAIFNTPTGTVFR
jgi:hypothetical protein